MKAILTLKLMLVSKHKCKSSRTQKPHPTATHTTVSLKLQKPKWAIQVLGQSGWVGSKDIYFECVN